MREGGRLAGSVLTGAYPMLNRCITGISCFVYFVVTSVIGGFTTSALYLVLSGLQNLFFSFKCTRQQCMLFQNAIRAVRF